MFIVLEGADGTGKSTLTTMFADSAGAVAYATPPSRYRGYVDRMNREADPDQHYSFFRDSIHDASTEIERLLSSGKDVVCDRYWLSTLTYHEVMGATVDHDDFRSIVKPDLTILLAMNPDDQIKRILERGMSSGDRRMLDKQLDLTERFFHNLIVTDSRFAVIDTGSFSIGESINFLSQVVK